MADEYEKQAERTDYYVAQKKQSFVVIPQVMNMRSREKTIPRRTRGLRRRSSRLNVSPAASSLFKPLLAIPAANFFFFLSRVSRNSTTEKPSTNLDKWILTPHSKAGMHVETGPLACSPPNCQRTYCHRVIEVIGEEESTDRDGIDLENKKKVEKFSDRDIRCRR